MRLRVARERLRENGSVVEQSQNLP
jgi:hypothetical protein